MSTTQDTPQNSGQSGGISIGGSVGGSVHTTHIEGDVTGDIVIGNKTVETSTTMNYGFQQEADKTEFLKQIEELRAALRTIKSGIESSEDLDEDQKDELAWEVMQQIKDLKTVKTEAEAIPAGEDAPKDKVALVQKYLDNTTTMMEKLKKMGEATAAASTLILPAVVQAWPYLKNALRLIGLP